MTTCHECGSHMEEGEQFTEIWVLGTMFNWFPNIIDVSLLPSCNCCLEIRSRKVHTDWYDKMLQITGARYLDLNTDLK